MVSLPGGPRLRATNHRNDPPGLLRLGASRPRTSHLSGDAATHVTLFRPLPVPRCPPRGFPVHHLLEGGGGTAQGELFFALRDVSPPLSCGSYGLRCHRCCPRRMYCGRATRLAVYRFPTRHAGSDLDGLTIPLFAQTGVVGRRQSPRRPVGRAFLG